MKPSQLYVFTMMVRQSPRQTGGGPGVERCAAHRRFLRCARWAHPSSGWHSWAGGSSWPVTGSDHATWHPVIFISEERARPGNRVGCNFTQCRHCADSDNIDKGRSQSQWLSVSRTGRCRAVCVRTRECWMWASPRSHVLSTFRLLQGMRTHINNYFL